MTKMSKLQDQAIILIDITLDDMDERLKDAEYFLNNSDKDHPDYPKAEEFIENMTSEMNKFLKYKGQIIDNDFTPQEINQITDEIRASEWT